VPNPAPQRISVRTPPPVTAMTPASQSNLDPRVDLEGTSDHVNSYQPHASTTPQSSTEHPPRDARSAQEPLIELDDDMEIETEIGYNFCKISEYPPES